MTFRTFTMVAIGVLVGFMIQLLIDGIEQRQEIKRLQGVVKILSEVKR